MFNRLQKYEKYGSHEFNLFLYFKDRIFFDNVVKPYLPSKKDKDFIDHFVLDNFSYFETLLGDGQIQTLDTMKIVLAFYS